MDTEPRSYRVPTPNTIYQGDVLEVLKTFPDVIPTRVGVDR